MPPKKKEDMTPEEYEALKVKLADMRLKAVAKAQERREAVEKAKAEALASYKPKRYVPVGVRRANEQESLIPTAERKAEVAPSNSRVASLPLATPSNSTPPAIASLPETTPVVVPPPATPAIQGIASLPLATPEPINMPSNSGIASLPLATPKATPVPKRVKSPPRTPEEEGFDLEKYFEAKYKAKSKYYPKKEAVVKEQPVPIITKPEPPSTQYLLQQNASQAIRARVNEDLLKMAMRNVFGDY